MKIIKMDKYYKIIIGVVFLVMISLGAFYHFNKTKNPISPKVKEALYRQGEMEPSVKLVSAAVSGRIAIVLDDWGYNIKNFYLLSQINDPITISVLPNLRYSKQAAQTAKKEGKQVILHLPLESKSGERPEKDTLYCSMSKKEITWRLYQILNSVPGIVGVNNHQGSKVTEDERMMDIILSELNKRGLFFLDSFTTYKSICRKAAQVIGIKYAKRDVFVDLPPVKLNNEKLHMYIEGQLDKLYEIAIKKGYAVGIGHDRKDTLEVLNEVIPQLKKKGIQFVFISELAK